MARDFHSLVPAAYLLLWQDEKVLLLRRYNTSYQDGNYSLIAGHVEPGETFTQCVIREAKEEAGIDLVESSLRVVHVMHRDSQQDRANERVDVFFLADRREGEIINQEPHKCDDLSRFLLSNLPENIIPYIAQVLAEVYAGHIYSEHGWTA